MASKSAASLHESRVTNHVPLHERVAFATFLRVPYKRVALVVVIFQYEQILEPL